MARQIGILEMSISVQALDGIYGRSAAGVRARLERADNSSWHVVSWAETDSDGCITDWRDQKFERGLYRIILDSDYYFVALGVSAAYPEISVMFRMQDESDSYRIQVLLSPYTYSTYFGSHN